MFQNSIKLILIAFCFLFSPIFGQDLEKDLTEIGKIMEAASSVSISVDVRMYSSKGGSSRYSGNAKMIRSGESIKSVLGEMEYINTPTFEVRVDHEEKEVLIFKKARVDSNSTSPKHEEVEFDIEALKKLMESEGDQIKPTVKLVSSSAGIKKYSITGVQGVKESVIELDMNTKKLVSVRYEYGSGSEKGQYVVLNYTKFKYNSDVSSVFNLSKYFTENEGLFVLAPSFKGYNMFTEI